MIFTDVQDCNRAKGQTVEKSIESYMKGSLGAAQWFLACVRPRVQSPALLKKKVMCRYIDSCKDTFGKKEMGVKMRMTDQSYILE